jgi:ferredoxin
MEQHHSKRLPGNVPGKYFTTEDCDGCAYCASVAPEHFDYEKSTNTYYVARQPKGREEEEIVLEAMDDCPLDAIRSENGNAVGVRRDAAVG